MKKLECYLGRSVITATLLTLLSLVSLTTCIKFLEQLRGIGQGDYNLWRAGGYTLLTLPEDIQLLFPFSALIGVLLGLGLLASQGEITVMQALGCSRWRIMVAIGKALCPLIILCMILGEWVVPWSDQFARQLRAQAIEGGSLLVQQGELWLKDGSDFIYIQQVTPHQGLQGIHIYHFDQLRRLTAITQAQYASFHQDHWLLHHCVKQQFTLGKPITIEQSPVSHWPLLLTPEKLGMTSLEPNQLSMIRLYRYIKYLRHSGQESNRYELALWKQLLAPLSTLSITLLALSSLLGPLRQTSVSLRIIIGITYGFIFYILSELISHLSIVYHWPSFWGAITPLLIVLLLTFLLFKQHR
ncbi:MAG: LPS export ABC transporter permease LptG [Candidatus Symbiodolus clandestinus]